MIQTRSTPTGACSEVYSYCSPSARLQVKVRLQLSALITQRHISCIRASANAQIIYSEGIWYVLQSRKCATNWWRVRGVCDVHIARPTGEAARVLSGSKTIARASKKTSESLIVKGDEDWLPTEVFSGLPQV